MPRFGARAVGEGALPLMVGEFMRNNTSNHDEEWGECGCDGSK